MFIENKYFIEICLLYFLFINICGKLLVFFKKVNLFLYDKIFLGKNYWKVNCFCI